MTGGADIDRGAWANRLLGWDERPSDVTDGTRGVTNGFWRALMVIAGLLSLACFVNVTTALDDAPGRDMIMPLWRPLAIEVSSNVVLLLLAPTIYFVIRQVWDGPLWQRIAILAAGSVPYSLAHVTLMTWARGLIFAVAGQTYAHSRGVVIYEFRKDVLTYVLLAGVFWFLSKPQAIPVHPDAAIEPAVFDIREGSTLIRVPIDNILAAQAAGNYVEFMLVDGQRPLMRTSLMNVEAQLSPTEMVRTHRSWLVNARRVRSIAPAGSGDFRLGLGQDIVAPLSRRYQTALTRLRENN
jgi:hypothetical protein